LIVPKEVRKVEGRNKGGVVSWQWLLLVAVSFVLLPGTSSAQSLAEIAKKEKERRAKVNPEGESHVITERDLQGSYSALSSSREVAPAVQGEGGSESGADLALSEDEEGEEEPDETQTREYWQTRVQETKQKIQELEGRLQGDELQWGGGMRTDVNPVGQKNLSERQEVERQLAEARAELRGIQAEARRAGVPPGWVR
jgi:hypothetical protein